MKNQRLAMIVAAALTAFVLVVLGGLTAYLGGALTQASAAPGEPTAAGTPLDPTVEALIRQREAAYQQALAEANARLEAANARIAAANAQSAQTDGQAATLTATPQPTPTFPITPDQARTIAMNAAPGATIVGAPELVRLAEKLAYEVPFDQGNIYIDVESGEVLANQLATPQPSSGIIDESQAIRAATEYYRGQVVKVERENEHGTEVYEVKFSDGSKVYVDAVTGQIVYAKIRQADADDDYKSDDDHDHDDWR